MLFYGLPHWPQRERVKYCLTESKNPKRACDWYRLQDGEEECAASTGASISGYQGCISEKEYLKCAGTTCDATYYTHCPSTSDCKVVSE